MEPQILTQASHTLQTVGLATLFVALLYFLPQINYAAQLRKLPAYQYTDKRSTYLKSAGKLYRDGYKQVGHRTVSSYALLFTKDHYYSSKTTCGVWQLPRVL